MITQDQIKQVNSDDGRYYELEINGDIHKLISVTTVLGSLLSKPALVPWAYNIGVEQGIKAIQDKIHFEIRKTGGETDSNLVDGILNVEYQAVKKYLKDKERTYDNQRAIAADRGTLIHLLFESVCDGIPFEELRGNPEYGLVSDYIDQIDKFCDEYQPTFVQSELKVFSLSGGYAGTLDTVCKIGAHPKRRRHKDMTGETVVLDLKTNKEGKIYPEAHFLQVTAYENAYKQMGNQCDGGMVLAVGEQSYSVGHNYFSPDSFDCVLAAYNMIDKCKKLNPNARKK